MKKTNVIKKSILTLFLSCLMIFLIKADVFAAKKPEFTVTYLYGSKSFQQTVVRGQNAIAPKDVIVPGYTFIGWSDSGKNIQSDKIILGMYTNNTMYKSATNASTKSKKINDKISAPGKFWWDLSLKGVPYETCVVRWYNYKTGDIWKTDVVPYGTTLPDPQDPQMSGYEFAGWEGSWYNITEDRNIAAYFTVIEEAEDLTLQTIENDNSSVTTSANEISPAANISNDTVNSSDSNQSTTTNNEESSNIEQNQEMTSPPQIILPDKTGESNSSGDSSISIKDKIKKFIFGK